MSFPWIHRHVGDHQELTEFSKLREEIKRKKIISFILHLNISLIGLQKICQFSDHDCVVFFKFIVGNDWSEKDAGPTTEVVEKLEKMIVNLKLKDHVASHYQQVKTLFLEDGTPKTGACPADEIGDICDCRERPNRKKYLFIGSGSFNVQVLIGSFGRNLTNDWDLETAFGVTSSGLVQIEQDRLPESSIDNDTDHVEQDLEHDDQSESVSPVESLGGRSRCNSMPGTENVVDVSKSYNDSKLLFEDILLYGAAQKLTAVAKCIGEAPHVNGALPPPSSIEMKCPGEENAVKLCTAGLLNFEKANSNQDNCLKMPFLQNKSCKESEQSGEIWLEKLAVMYDNTVQLENHAFSEIDLEVSKDCPSELLNEGKIPQLSLEKSNFGLKLLTNQEKDADLREKMTTLPKRVNHSHEGPATLEKEGNERPQKLNKKHTAFAIRKIHSDHAPKPLLVPGKDDVKYCFQQQQQRHGSMTVGEVLQNAGILPSAKKRKSQILAPIATKKERKLEPKLKSKKKSLYASPPEELNEDKILDTMELERNLIEFFAPLRGK